MIVSAPFDPPALFCTGNPRTREAMKQAGLSIRGLAGIAGLHRSHAGRATLDRPETEEAGKLVRVLASRTNPGHRERREVFHEMVNFPGESTPLAQRISPEDPLRNR